MSIKRSSIPALLTAITLTVVTNVSFIKNSDAALSWFSRANCLTLNESISWDTVGRHWLWTYTGHYKNGVFQHGWNTGWQWTWRSYAGHSDGFTSGWYVWGNHYRFHSALGGTVHLGTTSAVDCNLSQW